MNSPRASLQHIHPTLWYVSCWVSLVWGDHPSTLHYLRTHDEMGWSPIHTTLWYDTCWIPPELGYNTRTLDYDMYHVQSPVWGDHPSTLHYVRRHVEMGWSPIHTTLWYDRCWIPPELGYNTRTLHYDIYHVASLVWDDHPSTLHYENRHVGSPCVGWSPIPLYYDMYHVESPVWGNHPPHYTVICIMLSYLCGVITHPITLWYVSCWITCVG